MARISTAAIVTLVVLGGAGTQASAQSMEGRWVCPDCSAEGAMRSSVFRVLTIHPGGTRCTVKNMLGEEAGCTLRRAPRTRLPSVTRVQVDYYLQFDEVRNGIPRTLEVRMTGGELVLGTGARFVREGSTPGPNQPQLPAEPAQREVLER